MSLKEAIAALRGKVSAVEGLDSSVLADFDQLSTQAGLYDGIDPEVARSAIEQLDAGVGLADANKALKTQVETLMSQVQTTQKEMAGLRGLTTAGVKPEYEGLLSSQVVGQMTVGPDGAIQIPDGLWDTYKAKYPEMFYAEDAAGTGGTGGEPGEDKPHQVTATGGVVSGLDPDSVLSGKVAIV